MPMHMPAQNVGLL